MYGYLVGGNQVSFKGRFWPILLKNSFSSIIGRFRGNVPQ
jgi:hypothetical protein